MQETSVQFLGRNRLPTPVFLGFPCGSAGRESSCNAGNLGLIPGLGRSPGEGKGYPLQYSGMDNSINCVQSMGSQKVRHDWVTFTFYVFDYVVINWLYAINSTTVNIFFYLGVKMGMANETSINNYPNNDLDQYQLLYFLKIDLITSILHPQKEVSGLSQGRSFNKKIHQGLFQWVGSLHQVAKALEL